MTHWPRLYAAAARLDRLAAIRSELIIVAAGLLIGVVAGAVGARAWVDYVGRLGELGCVDEEGLQ